MTDALFKKTVENFTCEHCGKKIKGTGYTNHCPHCLYSKHVDIHPGDRAQNCGGLMPVVNFELEKGKYILVHKCQKCGMEKKNRLEKNDNMDALVKLSETIAKKLMF